MACTNLPSRCDLSPALSPAKAVKGTRTSSAGGVPSSRLAHQWAAAAALEVGCRAATSDSETLDFNHPSVRLNSPHSRLARASKLAELIHSTPPSQPLTLGG